MADEACPAGCGREKRPTDLLCRRCWYVLPDSLKQAYRDARSAVNTSKTRRAIDSLIGAKKNILDSVTPKGNPS